MCVCVWFRILFNVIIEGNIYCTNDLVRDLVSHHKFNCLYFDVDFDSWSGFWHVEYLEIDGQAYSSNFMMEIAIDGTITTKNCNTSIVTLCGTGYIRLNRVDGINDFYYIEGLSLPSKAVERIKLSENQSMIEFLR